MPYRTAAQGLLSAWRMLEREMAAANDPIVRRILGEAVDELHGETNRHDAKAPPALF